MLRCKFCGDLFADEDIKTEEHIFPKAIGGRLVLWPVHKKCNSDLGELVDSKLTNDRGVLIRRHEFKLVGNSGQLPNPLMGVKLTNEHGLPFSYNPKTDFKRNRNIFSSKENLEVYQEIDEGQTDEDALDRLVENIQKEMRRRNVEPFSREEIVQSAEKLHQTHRLEADVSYFPFAHQPALIKIAYELGVYWLGEKYLDDPKASELRSYLVNPDQDFLLNGNLKFIDEDKESVWVGFNKPRKSHLAALKCIGAYIGVRLRIFDLFDAMVVLSENRELYPDAKDRFLEIDPVDLKHEECDLEKAYGLIAQVKPSVGQGMWVDFRSLIKTSNKP